MTGDDPFAVLAEPIRRRLIEILAAGEQPAGELARVAAEEFGIGQPASSMHLRVLRESGICAVRAQGSRRLYRLTPGALAPLEAWLAGLRREWDQPLDALATEVARGKRGSRQSQRSRGAKAG